MVKDSCLYLFIGEDSFSKDAKLEELKKEFLSHDTAVFNFDILYAKELKLVTLQERVLALPLKSKKRIILIKDAQALKQEIKDFLLTFAKENTPHILLVLDINSTPKLNRFRHQDNFSGQIARYAKVYQFKETLYLDTFALARQIESKRADYALKTLNQLLENGEKPEFILGGLRYSYSRGAHTPLEIRKIIKLLLNCDISIKTGRLKPEFALERLVVRLCSS
jgi:DNA polymerase III delta subunit